jgi:prolyl 4-hydroxylase
MMAKTPNEKVPNYTKVGFEKFCLSDDLLKRIQRFYHDNIDDQNDEFIDGGFIQGKASRKTPSSLLDLPEYLKKEIHDYLKPLMEEWSGTLLQPTYVYGIRTYHDTAVLKSHRDRLETHIISCIINIFQDVEEDWPLQIDDNYYRKHDVMMEEGDMIFYEGARLDHGRENPLKGKAFANIFCHFMPVDYIPPQK